MRYLSVFLISFLAVFQSFAADPTATNYTIAECDGSLTPYPSDINPAVYPDSLTPVFINHVGRHGSRYPASAANCLKLRRALQRADSAGTITPVGRQLKKLNDHIIARSEGQWGALDSLGMAEQRAIASRMFYNFGRLFTDNAPVNAISSYSPRSMMSMYCFLHQLDRMSNKITVTTSTGRLHSDLLRPFDTSQEYIDFRNEKLWEPPYAEYFDTFCPTAPIRRALGERFPFADADEERDLAITEYYVVAGCNAMSINPSTASFFSREEYNSLWSCFNLRQYLQRSASTVSFVPAEIATDLLINLIETTDDFISGKNPAVAQLRFGHAETILPLVALLRLKGCYYMTNYFDTVALHWRDFYIVPMAANVQMILFQSTSGKYYLRVDLNEKPVPLIPNNPSLYLPWAEARNFLTALLPLIAQ